MNLKYTQILDMWISTRDLYNTFNDDPASDWIGMYLLGGDAPSATMHWSSSKELIFEQLGAVPPPVGATCNSTEFPVLREVPIWSQEKRFGGVADLLITAEKLKELFPHITLSCEGYCVAGVLSGELPLQKDGIHLRNPKPTPLRKAELFLLGDAYGRSSPAFMIGLDQKGALQVGVVDFTREDASHAGRAMQAVEWVRRVRAEGSAWSIRPPELPELYPNMKARPNRRKAELALDIGELTMLPYCTPKQRALAHAKGVLDWRDPRCTATLLGLSGNRAGVVDNILLVNREGGPDIAGTPVDIPKGAPLFVDFELGLTGEIRVAGIWDPQRGFRSFTGFDEEKVKAGFAEYVSNLPGRKVLVYWSADKSFWQRRGGAHMQGAEWFDLAAAFRSGCIAVRGAFSYKLKELVCALADAGRLPVRFATAYRDESCKSGLDAMDAIESGRWDEVLRYNRVDCEVLEHMLKFSQEM